MSMNQEHSTHSPGRLQHCRVVGPADDLRRPADAVTCVCLCACACACVLYAAGSLCVKEGSAQSHAPTRTHSHPYISHLALTAALLLLLLWLCLLLVLLILLLQQLLTQFVDHDFCSTRSVCKLQSLGKGVAARCLRMRHTIESIKRRVGCLRLREA